MSDFSDDAAGEYGEAVADGRLDPMQKPGQRDEEIEEWERQSYPSERFADVDLAKTIKKILHPKGFENLYPETEDELGNPKIAQIIDLILLDRSQREIEARIAEWLWVQENMPYGDGALSEARATERLATLTTQLEALNKLKGGK